MKKFVSMILIFAMALSLAACGSKSNGNTGSAPQEVPGSALEVLETVWGKYAEEQKFPVIGGSLAAPVDNAPGGWDMTDENITYSLLIPADRLGDVTEAASMLHMMNSNTFTAAAFKMADGVSAADFGAAMKDAVLNNQWICGFPETLLICDVAGAYVVMAFGAEDLVNAFSLHLGEAYEGREVLTQEPVV